MASFTYDALNDLTSVPGPPSEPSTPSVFDQIYCAIFSCTPVAPRGARIRIQTPTQADGVRASNDDSDSGYTDIADLGSGNNSGYDAAGDGDDDVGSGDDDYSPDDDHGTTVAVADPQPSVGDWEFADDDE